MKKILGLIMAIFFSSTVSAASGSFDSLTVYSHTVTPPLDLLHSIPGPMAKSLSTYPNYWEFSRSGHAVKGAVGALGSFEMNLSTNMDYATGTHRFYDQAKDAYWIALGVHGFFLQYAPASTASGDVWNNAGNQYGFKITMQSAEFNGDVTPVADGASSVGSPSKRFNALFLESEVATSAGAITINKPSGRAIVAAGETSVVVNNSMVSTLTKVLPNVPQSDEFVVAQAVSGEGIITLRISAVQTTDTPVDFMILN